MKTGYEDLTSEELYKEMEKKYGKNWTPPNYDEKDPLSVEWWNRASFAQ